VTVKWLLLIIAPLIILGYAVIFGFEVILVLHDRRPNIFMDFDVQWKHLEIIANLFGGLVVTLVWAAAIGAAIGILSEVSQRRRRRAAQSGVGR
jgi:hypothetical protein